MCHVPPIDSWQAPSSFRRFGASNGATPGPIGPAVRALFPKMLGHTYWLTDRQTRPANYFSPTHQWKSSFIERSMLKHLNVHSLRFWINSQTISACAPVFWKLKFTAFPAQHSYPDPPPPWPPPFATAQLSPSKFSVNNASRENLCNGLWAPPPSATTQITNIFSLISGGEPGEATDWDQLVM